MSAYALLNFCEEETKTELRPQHSGSFQNGDSSLFEKDANSEKSIGDCLIETPMSMINKPISPKCVVNKEFTSEEISYKNRLRMCEVEATVSSADVDTQQLLIHLYGSKKQRSPTAYAVKFKLTIDNNGRAYTCVRSMIKFVELRNRLLKEIKLKQKFGNIQIPELPTMGNDIICSNPSIKNKRIGNHPGFVSQETTEQTFGGWGFSMMQRFVFSQVKLMNDWLTLTCSLMPTSPSLLTFLWESPFLELGTIYETEED